VDEEGTLDIVEWVADEDRAIDRGAGAPEAGVERGLRPRRCPLDENPFRADPGV